MSGWRDQLRAFCLAQPGAVVEHPFRPQTDVFKVGGRMFAVLNVAEAPALLTVKADPERVVALQDEFACVGPGYHMDKRHWVSVDLARRPPGRLARELIEDSYDLVRDSLPRSVVGRMLPDS